MLRTNKTDREIKLSSYKDLVVYQKSYHLTLEIYKATGSFPKEEIYGLVSQMRRCSSSIPANIAEGYRRGHKKEYIQFLHVAFGSCAELETFLTLSKDLGYLQASAFKDLFGAQEDISRMLRRLISSLSRNSE